jgi:electron transfer flavoprotein beta subunit
MNIIVCMKQVPDTETRIRLAKDGKAVDLAGVKWVVNPYDEYALEEAIKLKEKNGGNVTIVSVGPQRTEEAIRTGLAMGADNAVLMKEELADPLATAKVLSAIISKMQYDLVLCGKQAIDDDSATVCPALAEYLGIPNVSVATKLELSADKKKATVTRQVEGADEVVETSLPAVISCQKGINVPRYPTLPNIMKAKKKEIKAMALQDIGMTKDGLTPSTTAVEVSLPAQRSAGKLVDGETPADMAAKLARLLREEAKVV